MINKPFIDVFQTNYYLKDKSGEEKYLQFFSTNNNTCTPRLFTSKSSNFKISRHKENVLEKGLKH